MSLKLSRRFLAGGKMFALFAAAALACAPMTAAAREAAADSGGKRVLQKEKWRHNFGRNFWDSHFDSRALAFHLAVGTAAVVMIESGADASIQRWASKHDKGFSQAWSLPGMIGGAVAPVAVPGGLMFFSDNPRHRKAGAAAMEAVAIAFVSSSLLKAVTNRTAPEEGKAATDEEAKEFRAGFLRKNIFDGFPSGHAATNMAMSAALAACYQDNPAVRAAAYGWAGYVAASAALGDQGGFHWASDVLVGGVMGWVIGDTVGRRCREESPAPRRFQVAPDLSNNGLQLIIPL